MVSTADFTKLTGHVVDCNVNAEGSLSFITEYMKFCKKTGANVSESEIFGLAQQQLDEAAIATLSSSLMDGLTVAEWWFCQKDIASLVVPAVQTQELMQNFGTWTGKRELLQAVVDSSELGKELFSAALESVQFENFRQVAFIFSLRKPERIYIYIFIYKGFFDLRS